MTRRSKTEKMSVTLPRELAGEIRALVPQGEVSAFFTEALQQYLTHRRQKLALEQSFGVWKDKAHPDLMTSRDVTAYVRSIREADRNRLARLGGKHGK